MHGHHLPHDNATSDMLAWSSHSASVTPPTEEEAGDADEPPDPRQSMSLCTSSFKRNPVRQGSEHHESLLTKALHTPTEEETPERRASLVVKSRRRSVTSNVSLASTIDLACDTDVTTPARTSSPSPRLPDSSLAQLPRGTPSFFPPLNEVAVSPRHTALPPPAKGNKDPTVQELEKKRCISFACAAKPKQEVNVPSPPRQDSESTAKPKTQDAPKRPAIRFACPARPPVNNDAPAQRAEPISRTPVPRPMIQKVDSATPYKPRASSAARHVRSATPKRSCRSPSAVRRPKKYLAADSKDLQSERSKFHEFASDEVHEDDWISRDDNVSRGRITIDDTLQKENAIRKLGKEAEEEAELEDEMDGEEGQGADDVEEDEDEGEEGEEEEEEEDDGDDDEDDNETAGPDDSVELVGSHGSKEDQDDLDFDDDCSGYGSDDDVSEGYKTDNEVGFADSDEEDDDLVLWTTGQVRALSLSGSAPTPRHPPLGEDLSDSSAHVKTKKHRRVRIGGAVARPDTPELPDSTDFVCGTLDEDRPLEEAYISCLAARKIENLRPIPQDIDPSFPTSEPEDEDEDEDGYENVHQGNDDQVWLHGELEDLHHEAADRKDRRKKTVQSPKQRYHSPPPKRQRSPAPPKGRGRSPGRRHSPLFAPQPSRTPCKSPPPSPLQGGKKITFGALPVRPGLVYTKSLPKSPALFSHQKKRGRPGMAAKQNHVRGAIDIVKGLEKKRQRRKEKFYQKYCTRARKNQAQVKKPPPGQGAQRMREVGLIMAGKIGPGNYVLSF